MKTATILYLVLILGIVVWVVMNAHIIDTVSEGFKVMSSEPVIAKGVEPTRLPIQAMPNASTVGDLPFAPYGQTASVGSFPYQDPALLPAELTQMKKLYEDLRSFLVFEGANIASSSDPTVQLPLTQLRADSRKLQQEISVLDKNPGIQSSLTQQNTADIEEALSFLQRKVRLFETSGVISEEIEGFTDGSKAKSRATLQELIQFQSRIYAAILTLSASGTTDPVVQSRIKNLQTMYSSITDLITKVNKGITKESDIPVFEEDITAILPNLANPSAKLSNVITTKSGKELSPVEKQLSSLVGEENAPAVFKNLLEKGMFNISVDLGYNTQSNDSESLVYSKGLSLQTDGTMAEGNVPKSMKSKVQETSMTTDIPMTTDTPFDAVSKGMDDRLEEKSKKPSGLDWKKRAKDICEQVRLRGMDPLDFGCIPEGSATSPAYSWRGYAKMVCGRLGSTLDPGLPSLCGCPPKNWKGWTLSY